MNDPWARFADAPAETSAVVSAVAPAAASAADPWAHFADAPSEASSTASDVAKSAGTGLVKGVTGTIGLPGAISDAVGNASEWAMQRFLKTLGVTPAGDTPQSYSDIAADNRKLSQGSTTLPRAEDLDAAIQKATGPYHQPQTTAGKYAETIGEFVPGAAIGPGGVVRKALGDVIAPAVASETAGQATKGTAAEPYARTLGALFGNTGSAAARSYQTAVPRTISRATRGVDDAAFTAGQGIQDTGTRIGIPLTGPESMQQATSSGTRLGDLQRVVESSEGGGPTMGQFYANRPQQIRTATGTALDAIAPASTTPSMLGPRASELAQRSVDDVRQGINTATRPLYQQAEQHVVPDAEFEPIARQPAFQASLDRLRNDPVLGPQYAHMPDNSGAVIDAVTKDMGARSQALSSVANPGFQPQTAAAYASGAGDARDILRDPARGGTQAYDDALTMQEQARRQNLDPLQHGPLGQVSRAGTTQAAYDALLPRQPLSGSQYEIGTAVSALAQRDPGLAAALLRQGIADKADMTMGRTAAGDNPLGGALFAKNLVGTEQRQSNLDAALAALPTGAAGRQAHGDLLPTLQATGKRKAPGSNTSADTEMRRDLGELPAGMALAQSPLSAGGTLLTKIRDAGTRAWLGRRTEQLGNLFIDPDSVARMAAMRAGYNEAPYFAAAGRTGLTLGDYLSGRRAQ